MKILQLLTVVLLCACGSPQDEQIAETPVGEAAMSGAAIDSVHNSRNSLDWPGTYSGTLPCADCAGIETTITLGADGSYRLELYYSGKSAKPQIDQGRFSWNAAGSIVTLDVNRDRQQAYQVGESILFHLDQSGNRISGRLADRYKLKKE